MKEFWGVKRSRFVIARYISARPGAII